MTDWMEEGDRRREKALLTEVEAPSKTVEGVFEGIPYKGAPINLKSTDNVDDKLKLNQVLRVRRFDLEKSEDLEEYERVCQSIQDGHAQLSFEKMEYDPERRQWIVLLRWIDWWWSPKENTSEDK